MTRIDEQHTTTTTTHQDVEPAKPHVENVNINTKGDTVSINTPEPMPEETTHTTTTTHTEVHETD